jgi:hypothetical protein
MAIVRLEGLGQLKNPITSSGIESATFRLVPYIGINIFVTVGSGNLIELNRCLRQQLAVWVGPLGKDCLLFCALWLGRFKRRGLKEKFSKGICGGCLVSYFIHVSLCKLEFKTNVSFK